MFFNFHGKRSGPSFNSTKRTKANDSLAPIPFHHAYVTKKKKKHHGSSDYLKEMDAQEVIPQSLSPNISKQCYKFASLFKPSKKKGVL